MEENENNIDELPQFNYDNEWVKFLSELSQNESSEELVKFVAANQWNDRQRTKIMYYCRIVLGKGLGTTYLENTYDTLVLYDKKALIDCDIPLGLLRVDITPEFNQLVSMLDYLFYIQSRKSNKGFFLNKVGLQKQQVEIENKVSQKGISGIKNRIFGGN